MNWWVVMKRCREDKMVEVKTKGQLNCNMVFRWRKIFFKMAGKNLKCQNHRIAKYHRIKNTCLAYIRYLVDRSVDNWRYVFTLLTMLCYIVFILFQWLKDQSTCLLWVFRWPAFIIQVVFHAKNTYNLPNGDDSK